MQTKPELQGFGPKLRQSRKFKGLTLRDLASAIGVTHAYLSKLETNSVPPPSDSVIVKLADVLGLDKDEMYMWASRVAPDVIEVLSRDQELVKLLRTRKEK